MLRTLLVRSSVVAAVAAMLASCGAGDDGADASGRPTIAVTTTVLGDVVADLVGDLGEVVTIMPRGASPHDFQASAQQAAVLAGADAIVVNGGGFEEGLQSVVDAAGSDGVAVLSALELLGQAGDDDRPEDDDDHAGDDEHAHDDDAHFFTDPVAVAEVVEALAVALPEQVPGLDADRLGRQADALVDELEALHDDLVATLAVVPAERRVLVTDHEVFDSFAARYDFEILATVIPAGSTSDGVSGGALAELARVVRSAGVTAVFTEQTASAELAETLADEVGDVEVVALNAETLGPDGSEADTYAGMMRSNAQRIADALGG